VLNLVEAAATDADVVAIKMILYRTAKNSRIIDRKSTRLNSSHP
jgi:polyphosphate kinase